MCKAVLGRLYVLGALFMLSGQAQAWSQRDDERNRVRAWTRMQSDTANFERYRDRQPSASSRPSASSNSAVSSSINYSSGGRATAFDAVANLGGTLKSILDRSQHQTASTASPQVRRETPEEARLRLQRDAQAGNVEAAVLLAKALYAGFGGVRSDTEALRYFQLAANKGHGEAQYHVGYLTMYGYGVTANPADAVEWYKKAATSGEVRGELGYALALLLGQGVIKNEGQALPLMERLATRQLPQNADAELKEAQALMAGLLGDFYRSGTGVQVDGKEAVRWYSIAAQNGDRFAARDLAKMYHEGDGISKDVKQSLAWLAKAAELGHPEAQANMALLLVQGKEFAKNVSAAKYLAEQSAQQGHAMGHTLIGDFYSDGTLPKDFARALEGYRKGAELGDDRARGAQTPELLRSAALLPANAGQDQTAAQQGQADAMLRLADRLVDGIGLNVNVAQALEWYEKATGKGSTTAQGMAGLLLVTGQGGRKDMAKGVQWIKAAAENGDPSAMLSMGDLFRYGAFGQNDSNVAQARQWYEKAKAAKHSSASERLTGL